MVSNKLVLMLATVVVFGSGAAAAGALADAPPTTTEPTTSAPTNTTATTTSTTSTDTATTTGTETSTTPAETNTTTITTTTAPISTATGRSPPRKATQTHTLPPAERMSEVPSGTLRPASPHRTKHRHRTSKPLKITPPLGQGAYVFPVVGVSGYGDSYGAFRGDVHGKWHHGDDIFASLGAPVVAVANGTINRVGWHKVGGWRLWVRDTAANQFYYAHLSGYAPRVFHTRYVRAGDVLGFVGNTGDAFGSEPHLHFEVHPHQLLRLRYDGAVDPTTYLNGWVHMHSVHAPFPVHPRLPMHPRLRGEARQVFRQLLVARHLIDQQTRPIEVPKVVRPAHDSAPSHPRLLSLREEVGRSTGGAGDAMPTVPLLAALLVIAFCVATLVLAPMVLGRLLRNRASESRSPTGKHGR
jgi:murein DD-endopeptidase MepM/ murein hydrolase activator NlpD